MVSLQKIILKMSEEIDRAKQTNDQAKIKEHVRAIRSLADLIVDENQAEPKQELNQTVTTELEMAKMLGDPLKVKGTNQLPKEYEQPKSLFDF